jgi:hypothetical protein
MSPLTDLTPHPSSVTRHCLIPFAPHFGMRLVPRLSLGHALSLASLSDAPPFLPTFWDASPLSIWFVCFLSFFLLFPLMFLFSQQVHGTPSRWQTRGGAVLRFSRVPAAPFSRSRTRGARRFVSFSFSLHSLTAPSHIHMLSYSLPLTSTCFPTRSFIARRPFVTRRPHHVALVMSRPSSHLLRRVAMSWLLRCAALSRCPIATCRSRCIASPLSCCPGCAPPQLPSGLWHKWRG